MRWFRRCFILAVTLLLISCHLQTTSTPLRNADAIVLLAGNHKERGPTAAALYRGGYAKRIILTNDGVGGGWSSKYGRNLTVIEWAEEDLVSHGVPRECIIKLPFYRSGTIYDALAVILYSRTNGFGRLIIVTSDYHARRSSWCFNRILIDNSMKLTVFPATNSGKLNLNKHIYELVKFTWYKFKYDLLHIEPYLKVA